MREPRRRGSFFHAWPVKEKERAYRPPKAAKLQSRRYSIPACTTWTMLLRTA